MLDTALYCDILCKQLQRALIGFDVELLDLGVELGGELAWVRRVRVTDIDDSLGFVFALLSGTPEVQRVTSWGAPVPHKTGISWLLGDSVPERRLLAHCVA